MIHGWILGGDFNEIMNSSEKNGGAEISHRNCGIFQEKSGIMQIDGYLIYGAQVYMEGTDLLRRSQNL